MSIRRPGSPTYCAALPITPPGGCTSCCPGTGTRRRSGTPSPRKISPLLFLQTFLQITRLHAVSLRPRPDAYVKTSNTVRSRSSEGGLMHDDLIDQGERFFRELADNAPSFLDDNYALRHAEVTPGQYVMIAVSDTGCGIDPEILEKVFDPFFSTKPEGRGTGLGLSMVHGFVKQSGGHIKIYSELGQGSTVRIYLPRSREDEDAQVELGASPAIGGSETILLVEDDKDLRVTTAEMLSELGYSVLRAKDADSALVIIESGAAIDLLFTDIGMPGTLRAPELARKAQQKIPGIAVLFTTGYVENAALHGGQLGGGINLITKPYARDQLGRKLRQILSKE